MLKATGVHTEVASLGSEFCPVSGPHIHHLKFHLNREASQLNCF